MNVGGSVDFGGIRGFSAGVVRDVGDEVESVFGDEVSESVELEVRGKLVSIHIWKMKSIRRLVTVKVDMIK